MQHYVYRHIRFDKNEPFYIGIGKQRPKWEHTKCGYGRAYTSRSRNKIWKSITAKTEWRVEIIFESDNLEEIKNKEIEFIKLYGRKNLNTGTLANLTNGGDGVTAINCSKLHRTKSAERIKIYASTQILDNNTNIKYESLLDYYNKNVNNLSYSYFTNIMNNKTKNNNYKHLIKLK